jgi:hypothetical protein
MPSAIGYLRVRTKEQGRSGLGLDAQKRAIEVFSGAEELSVISWYQTGHSNGSWCGRVPFASWLGMRTEARPKGTMPTDGVRRDGHRGQ